MSDIAIRAEGLGKQYRIGERQKYKALRDTLTDAIAFPFRYGRSFLIASEDEKNTNEMIWALKDVSFEIKQGEVVGVIGRNGAGKSTLLKILSRITEPTKGYVDLYGRVGSLLEVGTGFHPELTGRENVYLNGSIIGMTKREINRKFDEIVAFAEIEQFLDTPVKYYSTGMHMRLAFAVAAHLEPEILLVDEVLAVGDAVFQRKCLGKMGEVAKQGRTVIFVSHNLGAIKALAQRCLIIDQGQLITSGTVDDCIGAYLRQSQTVNQGSSAIFAKPSGESLWISAATLIGNDYPVAIVYMGDELSLCVDFKSERPIHRPRLGFMILNHDGIPIINSNNRFQYSAPYLRAVYAGRIRCDLGMLPLVEGSYQFNLYLGNEDDNTHVIERALSFEVIGRDIWGQGQVPPSNLSHLWWPTTFHLLDEPYPTLDQLGENENRSYMSN
jgi:homopolymeric O-antigen transport system ATP-binding protein